MLGSGNEEDVFVDCNLNEQMRSDDEINIDLWPLEEDPNNNDDNRNIDANEIDNGNRTDVQSPSDDLFDPNLIERLNENNNNNEVRFLKTTHVTGHGVSCELVSGIVGLKQVGYKSKN